MMSVSLEKDETSSTRRGEDKIEETMIEEEGWTGEESPGQDHQWASEVAEVSEVAVVHPWVGLVAVAAISEEEIDSRLKEGGGMRCPRHPRG